MPTELSVSLTQNIQKKKERNYLQESAQDQAHNILKK